MNYKDKSKLSDIQRVIIKDNENKESINKEIELLEKTDNLSKAQKSRLYYLKELKGGLKENGNSI